ncbi:MAG: phospho-sugar mutase [Bacteroidia bacterium]|nr:phospho-sugar mutase [Bacteroidia bacterium]
MENSELLVKVKAKASSWLKGDFDEETKKQVRYLLENDEKGLIDAFYCDLEFGTGGLRGIMGAGTNRMNIYTVGMATQGLCNYLKKEFSHLERIKIAIAHDSRNNSRLFAETTANICSANGFKVYLFDSLRPTPELSFAIRYYGCQSGVVVTASHNPKEYNGYKAYWSDGGQLINPHDINVIAEVQKIKSIDEVKFQGNKQDSSTLLTTSIEIIGEELDKVYIERVKSLSLSPEVIARQHDLKIVYTPLHGSGIRLVPLALKEYGFTNIFHVQEQDIISGDFPTVVSPNPEEPAALNLAIERAKQVDAELVLATDPDADRVGIAVKNNKGEYILLNGNQTVSLLLYYILTKWHENKKVTGREYIVKTIVTTELLSEIARKYHVECFDVLTGFKYIAEVIKNNEGVKTFIAGGEESYGYLAGEFVRDKDAVISCSLIAETAAWAKDKGTTLYNLLLDIYIEFGYYRESVASITMKGKEGAEEIKKMMAGYRANPLNVIAGSKVIMIKDYFLKIEQNLITGEQKQMALPQSDVLQFYTEDGSKISVRPSGTEPKIKFYFGIKSELKSKENFAQTNIEMDKRVERIKTDFKN